MKARGRRFGWIILMIGMFASSCGGDDEASTQPDARGDAGPEGEAPRADTGTDATRDRSGDESRDDASIDGGAIPADALPDAATADAGPSDVFSAEDASSEATAETG